VRGRLFGALLAATLFTALTGTAHAGYAYMETYSNDFDPIFYAGPGESPDLQFQVTDDLTSVVFEDRRNPITVGRPPVDEHDLHDGDTRYPEDREPCELLSRHKARCTGPPGFTVWRIKIETGDLPAEIRDVAGGSRAVDVFTGPLNDDITIDHQAAVFLDDAGGANRIRVGDGGGWMTDYDNVVSVGPGASEIDVRNGSFDLISCLRVPGLNPGVVLTNPLDTVLADANDEVHGCGVERP
jgi:hypothetical protein